MPDNDPSANANNVNAANANNENNENNDAADELASVSKLPFKTNTGKGLTIEEAEALRLEISKAKEDRQALVSEFANTTNPNENDIIKIFEAAAVTAANSIVVISTHADSEALRLSASKFIVNAVIAVRELDPTDVKIQKLLEELTAK